jgi:transcriptional regulator with GAF, ATPase, and Fis domain
MLDDGEALSLEPDRIWHKLQFQKLKAWLLGRQGEHEQAEQLLHQIMTTAQSHKLNDMVVRVHHELGIFCWRAGLHDRAREHLELGLGLAEQSNLKSLQVSLLAALSFLSYEHGDFQKAISTGKQAARLAKDPVHRIELQHIFYRISESHSRLSEHKKADYWHQRAWNLCNHISGSSAIVLHYLTRGYNELNSGKLFEANESLHTALNLTTSDSSPSIIGQILRGLAELAAWQGRKSDCEHHLSEARKVFDAAGVKAALAQVEFATDLYMKHSGGELFVGQLSNHLETLISLHCYYDAVRCLFHMLMLSEPEYHSELVKLSAPLDSMTSNSDVPLFKATDFLLRVEEPTITSYWIGALKQAYQVLSGANQSFQAMIVCQRIGELYVNSQKFKIARKFFRRALIHAESLDNSIYSGQIKANLEGVAPDRYSERRLIDSLHSISELFPNMDDRDACLNKLIGFAVEQTGAERGVLLLKRDDTDQQDVIAFINCDDESLVDIREFSTSIPVHVAKNGLPLIVENALADKRTKNYKSIVCHNIRSVICTPILRDNIAIGTLYLDHHTIPALFEEVDVKYVLAIANFVNSVLCSVQRVHDVNVMNRELTRDVDRLVGTKEFITQSPILKTMFSKLPMIARSTASILVQGESGTGKEILCKMLHDMSTRSKKPLVKLNSSAMSPTMIESELFGVAKKAATDVREREGRFEAADGGTLFLDEIGEMPLDLQTKVLRVIEYGEFQRVGSNRSRYVDVRIICATNKDLSQLVESKQFREDLYYRINTIVIEIPPLRSRRCDIPLLIEHFGNVFGEGNPPTFTAEAMRLLTEYDWPGNVRQLKNFVEYHCILFAGKRVGPQALPKELLYDAKLTGTLDQTTEMALFRNALIEHNWNQAQAARSLSMSLTTFRRKIKKYSIQKN